MLLSLFTEYFTALSQTMCPVYGEGDIDAIKELATVDLDVGWGDQKTETSPDIWMTSHVGDFNPWYDGALTLKDLLESIEPLVESMSRTAIRFQIRPALILISYTKIG